MPQITYRVTGGTEHVIATDVGTTVMRAAVSNAVPGIVGECGGQTMCATCHVYVHDEYLDVLPTISEDEDEMLDCTAAERRGESRLSCQIVMGTGIEEIVVTVPSSQI